MKHPVGAARDARGSQDNQGLLLTAQYALNTLDRARDPREEDKGLSALEAAQIFGNSATVLLLIDRPAKG